MWVSDIMGSLLSCLSLFGSFHFKQSIRTKLAAKSLHIEAATEGPGNVPLSKDPGWERCRVRHLGLELLEIPWVLFCQNT